MFRRLTLISLVLISGCSGGYFYNEELSPLENTILAADQIDNLFSLIVIRDNNTIIENYYNGNSRSYINNTQSVTKSIISLILGIAHEEGYIKGVGDRLIEYIYFDNEEFDSLSIEHLLTMTTGISWDENRDFIPWLSASSQVNFVFQRTLANIPGERFNYNSGAAHLLSPIIQKRVNADLQEYSINKLFKPLDIRNINWQKDNEGYFQASTGLSLRPIDLAKFGTLILNEGKWGEEQLLNPLWIKYIFTPRNFIRESWNGLDDVRYGALWWCAKMQNYKIYFAWGYGGQFLFIIPDLNAVVVTTGRWRVESDTALDTEEEVIELLDEFILPLLKNHNLPM